MLEPEFPTGDPAKDYKNARFEKSWSCELEDDNGPGRRFVEIDGIPKPYLDKHAHSGGSVLTVTGSSVDGNKMKVPPQANVQIEEMASSRRLAPSSGILRTLVVRVTGTKAGGTLVSPTASAAQLIDDVFNDSACLATQFARCSNGALTISKPTKPVKEVTIPTDPTNTIPPAKTVRKWMEGNATKLAGDLSAFDLVMFCQPPGNSGWIAYAYVNYKTSYYNDKWCSYSSTQMHEVGHNIVRSEHKCD